MLAVSLWLMQRGKNFMFALLPGIFMLITTIASRILILVKDYIPKQSYMLAAGDIVLLALAAGVSVLFIKRYRNRPRAGLADLITVAGFCMYGSADQRQCGCPPDAHHIARSNAGGRWRQRKKRILWLELAGFMLPWLRGQCCISAWRLQRPRMGMAVSGERKSLGTFKAQLISDCFLGPDPVCTPAAQQDLESVRARRCPQLLVCPAAWRLRGHYDHGCLLVAAVSAHGHINAGR